MRPLTLISVTTVIGDWQWAAREDFGNLIIGLLKL